MRRPPRPGAHGSKRPRRREQWGDGRGEGAETAPTTPQGAHGLVPPARRPPRRRCQRGGQCGGREGPVSTSKATAAAAAAAARPPRAPAGGLTTGQRRREGGGLRYKEGFQPRSLPRNATLGRGPTDIPGHRIDSVRTLPRMHAVARRRARLPPHSASPAPPTSPATHVGRGRGNRGNACEARFILKRAGGPARGAAAASAFGFPR